MLSMNMPNFLDHWGSLVLAAMRTFLYGGLVFLALTMFDNGLFSRETRNSFSSIVFKDLSIATYSFMYESIVNPLFGFERFNDRVYDIVAPPRRAPVEPGGEGAR